MGKAVIGFSAACLVLLVVDQIALAGIALVVAFILQITHGGND